MPRRHRIRAAGLIGAVGLLTSAVVALAATPVGIKTSPRNEVAPAASLEWFAWARSRNNRVSPYDVWVQRGTDAEFKVNARGTRAYPGGISGTRLVYQQILGANRSDLRLFDLTGRRHVRLPAGINTTRFECCPSLSGDRLLFSRGLPRTRQAQTVVLRDLTTGENRVLDRLQSVNGLLAAGQVTGNFAVWTRCSTQSRCQIRRYDVLLRRTTNLPVPAGKVVDGPSVNPPGTVYYVRSDRGCGRSVEIVRQPIVGGAEVLTALPAGQDVDVTHTVYVPGRALRPGLTRVFYDRVSCRGGAWDIFRLDDPDRQPPGPPPPPLP